VRIDDDAKEREEMRRRLRELETDPEQAGREYRERVLERATEVPRFRVARHLEPLDDVGGDLVWHRSYDEGTDLVVGDLMGHGVEASVHAAKLVMMLDALAAEHREPQDILAALNRGLIRHRPAHETAFATGILFRFGRDATRLRCASFGHAGPIFSRSGQVQLGVGLPLGMVETVPIWPSTELDLREHGTRFLVFSDGITEQFDADGAMYGTQRLVETFRSALDLDLDAMLRRIVEDVDVYRGDALVKDDRTLIALELAT
jgi:sigma-B regulation protein RsbU (phosphoserine phosphatase)